MTATPSPDQHLSRLLRFQRRTTELVADEVQDIPEGWVARTPSLPAVWSLNLVRVQGATTYDEALALSERHLGGGGYDQLYLDHEPTGEALAEVFRSRGWEVDVEVHSVLVGGLDRRPAAVEVVEPSEDEALALMERWMAEDKTLHLTPEGLRQLVESNRLTWRARKARRLGVRGPDGRLAAITLVFSDGSVGQVEDVYVIPEARGRGYGRALVTRAARLAREAGHELIFIVADDNDWPKQLYAKLGFEPVGRTWLLHREVRAQPRSG